MRPITLGDLAAMAGGELFGFAENVVTGFSLDNRSVNPGDVFLAVKGARVDGHDFCQDALSHGAAGCMVEHHVEGPHILVHNLVAALAKLGLRYRGLFNGPVVGVTGSAGKTMTKEFIAAALSPMGEILKTEGNRNTEYTAPLLWTELDSTHKAVVVEMAMRGFGQIAHLAAISKPTIGVVTNVGHSHIDLVGSREGVARAKGELLEALPANGLGVLWRDDEFFEFLKARCKGPVKTFGFNPLADCRITDYVARDWSGCTVSGTVNGLPWRAEVATVGRHVSLNVAAAILVAAELGVPPQAAADQIRHAELPPMRMEIQEYNGATVVLDAYNASPASMVAAIEALGELPCKGRRLAVIAEMKELGEYSAEAHRVVGEALVHHKIDAAIFLGDETTHARAAAAGVDTSMASSLADVTEFLKKVEPGDAVLIKGSRAMELEKALEPLMGAAL